MTRTIKFVLNHFKYLFVFTNSIIAFCVLTGTVSAEGNNSHKMKERYCILGDNKWNARLIADNVAYARDVLKKDKFEHTVPNFFGTGGHIEMTVKQINGRPSSTIKHLPGGDTWGTYLRAGTGNGYITQRWEFGWTKALAIDTYRGCLLYEHFSVMLFYQQVAK